MTAANVFLIAASVAVPAAAAAFMSVRCGSAKPAALGALCFFITQICIRLPLIRYILPLSADYAVFSALHPVAHMLLLAVSAGVFEECGRYALMRVFMKDAGPQEAVAFGVGHGGLEALLLVGINAVASLILYGGAAAASDMFWSGVERIIAVTAHAGLSVIVLRSVKKGALLPQAIMLHGIMDFVPALLMRYGAGVYAAEACAAFITAAICLTAARSFCVPGKESDDA